MKKLALAALLFASCSGEDSHTAHADMEPVTRAICVMRPTDGNEVRGMITFTQVGESVRVEADMFNLTPGDHGFHVHQLGDISSEDGSSCGGHFNPGGVEHGGRHAHERHVGDLGNLNANSTGYAHADFIDDHLALNGAHGIIGRSIIVHAGPDDFTSQPSGASGPRVAQGVIGITK